MQTLTTIRKYIISTLSIVCFHWEIRDRLCQNECFLCALKINGDIFAKCYFRTLPSNLKVLVSGGRCLVTSSAGATY